jgi:hypothetical protein
MTLLEQCPGPYRFLVIDRLGPGPWADPGVRSQLAGASLRIQSRLEGQQQASESVHDDLVALVLIYRALGDEGRAVEAIHELRTSVSKPIHALAIEVLSDLAPSSFSQVDEADVSVVIEDLGSAPGEMEAGGASVGERLAVLDSAASLASAFVAANQIDAARKVLRAPLNSLGPAGCQYLVREGADYPPDIRALARGVCVELGVDEKGEQPRPE